MSRLAKRTKGCPHQHAVGKVVDWDKDFLLRCTFWEGVVVSCRCSHLTATERFAPTVAQIKLSPKNGKVLSIPVWFDSENTGGCEGV